ncbi:hypothetical protein [Paraburkholderia sp.]|uniref:TPR end-of-group domain-containing protein n=1 Tax=Paraburkholderia sp. TaxID=1926495 RepID=UPI0025D3480F|nr:hypothetical protein [Paraburkholderia sp.]
MRAARGAAPIALAVLALVAGCSKNDDASVIGHWRAERTQVYSLHLPIGPDIVISKDAIKSPDAQASIPLKRIERKGNEAVLDTAYGLGISLYFDGPDRVYVKVPFMGKVYYRRVPDGAMQAGGAADRLQDAAARPPGAAPISVPVVAAAAHPSQGTPQSRPREVAPASAPASTAAELMKKGEAALHAGAQTQAESLLTRAQAWPAAHPAVDYDLAVLAARRSDADRAIEYLNQAFKLGYRQFGALDATPEFSALRQDVRYQALVARYR